MSTPLERSPVSSTDHIFETPQFSINHLSTSRGGLTVTTRSIGRTAGLTTLHLTSDQRDNLRASIPGEMKFRGVEVVRQARNAWHKAMNEGATDPTIRELRNEFFSRRDDYMNTGKKVGLRNIHVDPNNPNHIEADAALTDYVSYILFATPETTGALAELASPTGVAMALITSDKRLVLQHRATETLDYISGKKKPGNMMYGDIPGVSVGGMADASLREKGRTPGTPDSVSDESLMNSVLKEAGEELGIGPEHFSSKKIVGIARDHVKPHNEILFLGTTTLSSSQLRAESQHSTRNKNLSAADLEEKHLDIEATPEAIKTLLTEVKSPLASTHAAAYVAAGHALMLERSGEAAATSWLNDMEKLIAENYRKMDEIVQVYYQMHPEATSIIPERLWTKQVIPERSLNKYNPTFTPEEQGLPNLEDELVRTGLIAETRNHLTKALLFDVDGVLTHPSKKRVTNPALFDELIGRLTSGEYIALNTGRSTTWLATNFLAPLLDRVEDPAILSRLFCVGEKGGTWATISPDKRVSHGKVDSIALPEDLKKQVEDLVTTKYAGYMFYDATKETMISVEMVDGGDIEEFQHQQQMFAADVQAILHKLEKEKSYRVDATTIATDIENPHVSKALGARRFIEYLKSQDTDYASAQFEAYGDSPSDTAMGDELARLKLDTTFVFVGNPAKLAETSPYYPVVKSEGYDDATLRYLIQNK